MSSVILPAVAVAISAVDLLLLLHGLHKWALMGTAIVGAVCVIIVSRLIGRRAHLGGSRVTGRVRAP